MTAAARMLNRHAGKPRVFSPLRLRSILMEYRIAQVELANAVEQANGKTLSRTSLSLLMNYCDWPAQTKPEAIKSQVAAFLLERGVPEDIVAQAWESDQHAEDTLNHRYAQGRARAPNVRYLTDKDLIDIPEKEMLTPAAKTHFKLFRDPFLDEIRGPDDLYFAADQRYIREAMYQTTRNGGFIAVIGESGAGKTTLRLDLIERIHKEGLPISFIQPRVIDKTKLTSRMICEAILGDLVPSEPTPQSPEKLTRKVEKVLLESYRSGNRHVIVIEEAQDLVPQALKHLKRFYELQAGYQKLLSVILVGQPELKNLLDERQHPNLREVIRRCEIAELQPLDTNVKDYLAVKFDRIGKKLPEVFTPDAFDAIVHRLTRDSSRGKISMVYPLVVNNMTTKAMNLAATMGEAKVSAEVVKEV
jgi:type II secretory pathway predicted ATPase ExeA